MACLLLALTLATHCSALLTLGCSSVAVGVECGRGRWALPPWAWPARAREAAGRAGRDIYYCARCGELWASGKGARPPTPTRRGGARGVATSGHTGVEEGTGVEGTDRLRPQSSKTHADTDRTRHPARPREPCHCTAHPDRNARCRTPHTPTERHLGAYTSCHCDCTYRSALARRARVPRAVAVLRAQAAGRRATRVPLSASPPAEGTAGRARSLTERHRSPPFVVPAAPASARPLPPPPPPPRPRL